MPTAEQRLQKRKTKRLERRAVKLHSSVCVGHSMALPEPPDFGIPKFTPEEQAANPGKALTRLIKDVLRVGRWKEGFDAQGRPIFGDYDEPKLTTILNNAVAMIASGHAINVGKSHGDEQLIIPPDELIAPVDAVKLSNGVLWVSMYVTPAQADYLSNPARKVSAGLYSDYPSGDAKIYAGPTMLHVAVTDRPVVTGQGPFIALSNYVAFGTWDENKHKRDGGKFASKGGGSAAEKRSSARKAGAVAGAGVAASDPTVSKGAKNVAKKAFGSGSKLVKRFGKAAKKAGGAVAKKAGEAAGQAAKAGVQAGAKAGQAALKTAGEQAKNLGQRVAKSGQKAIRSGVRAGLKAAKSKGVRSSVKVGAARTLKVAGRILRTVKKFSNEIMPRAIALANTLEGGSGTMDILALIAAINAILAKLGVQGLPDNTDETNLIPRLEGVAMVIGGLMSEEETEPPEGTEGAAPAGGAAAADQVAAAVQGGQPVAMSNLLAEVDKRIGAANRPLLDGLAALTAAINGKSKAEGEDKKGRYMAFKNSLGKAGISAAVLDSKDKIGEAMDWDLNVLEGLHPTIRMNNLVSGAAATVDNPADKSDVLTESDLEARLKAKGIDSKFIPK